MTSNVWSMSHAAVFHAPPHVMARMSELCTDSSTRHPHLSTFTWTMSRYLGVFVDLISLSDLDNGVVQAPTAEVRSMSLAHAPGWKARPTVYSGIQMRSRLEATFAETLDRLGLQWAYEPRAYGAKNRRQYLPDFEIRLKTYRYFVEVKPTPELAMLAMAEITVIWESDPEAGLIVTCPEASWVADPGDPDWLPIDLPWGRRG